MNDGDKTLIALVAIGAALAVGVGCLKYADLCGWLVRSTLTP